MARDGLYWFKDPGIIGQKLTARASKFGAEVGALVSESLDEATEFMRDAVRTRGVYRGQPTGGGRIDTGAMYSSIDSEMTGDGGDKVSGNFGFINDAPDYTVFQEFGTRRTGWYAPHRVDPEGQRFGQGIVPMHAFSDAQEHLVNDLRKRLDVHEWWTNF